MSQNNSVPFDPDDSASIQHYNNLKLTADKVRQILSKVRNNPGDSARRWVWELLQNAKDVPNSFGGVTVDTTLSDNKLVFRHDGDPFTLAQLHSLVQQVSSKSSVNDDAEVTGKFGTGFIATHLLSPQIEVSGQVSLRDKLYQLNLLLDRSGESSEELIEKIGQALDTLKKTDDPSVFIPVDGGIYQNTLADPSFSTSFTYRLTTEEAIKAAEDGLEDLVHTLPIALLTNGTSIKKVGVNNRGSKYYYVRRNSRKVTEGIEVTKIDFYQGEAALPTTTTICSYSSGQVTLVIVLDSLTTKDLVPKHKSAPYLYRDFPLIGSHKFFFPFIINGKDFNPTEDRNGLLLHSKEDINAEQNRRRIEDAFEAAKNFTLQLVEFGVGNRYRLAISRLPDEKWQEGITKEWYTTLQRDYRKFLRTVPLVKVAHGDRNYLTLDQAYLPYYEYGTSDEDRLTFYDLALPFVTSHKCPVREDLLDWIECIGPKAELNTWTAESEEASIGYGLDNLLDDLEQTESLAALSIKLEEVDPIAWLEQLYIFLIEHNKEKEIRERAIVPNDYGTFIAANARTLWKENTEDPFTDYFLDILRTVDPQKDWRQQIAHRRLNILSFITETRGLSDIFTEINATLRKRKGHRSEDQYIFPDRTDSVDIIANILRVERSSASTDKFRTRLYDHAHALLNTEFEKIYIENIQEDYFSPAIRVFISAINHRVEKAADINGLSRDIGGSETEAYNWLNTYLNELNGSEEFRKELNVGQIVPNQKGEFYPYASLENPGTKEDKLPTDLIKILSDLNRQEDWEEDLVSDHIDLRVKDDRTLKQLADAIEGEVSSIQDESRDDPDKLYQFSDPLLRLIDWLKGTASDSQKAHFHRFQIKEAGIFTQIALGGGKIKTSDIALLQNPNTVDLIRTAESSTLSNDQISHLIRTVDSQTYQQVLKQAEELHEEQAHKKAMVRLGNTVERMVAHALQASMPSVHVSQPTGGRGFFDIEVFNSDTSKKFWLELKSYASNTTAATLLFAPSQAKQVVKNIPNYGICLLQRPPGNEEIPEKYITENLRFRKSAKDVFQVGYRDYLLHDEMRKRTGPSILALSLLGEPRVKVDRSALLQNSTGFAKMIKDIKLQIS
jgi:hypothetical protein